MNGAAATAQKRAGKLAIGHKGKTETVSVSTNQPYFVSAANTLGHVERFETGRKIFFSSPAHLPQNPQQMAPFLAFIDVIQQISSALTQALDAIVRREILPVRHQLLRPGEVARRLYFLETGLMRTTRRK